MGVRPRNCHCVLPQRRIAHGEPLGRTPPITRQVNYAYRLESRELLVMSQSGESLYEIMDRLNRQFYRNCGPADYLFMRLSTLCVVGGATDAFRDILAEGVEFGGTNLRLSYPEQPDATVPPSDQSTDDTKKDYFVRIESHHLKHLAIETLLRLFLGHINVPPCPWVEMSKVTYDFKKQVETQIVNADPKDLQANIRQIMLGLPRSAKLLTEEQEGWDISDTLADVLRLFAADWLDEAKSYNATKHGLTAVPGAAEFSIGPQGEEPVNIASGDSLSHLVHSKWDRNTATRQWSSVTRWITINYAVTTVVLVRFMIQALWSVARAQYGLADSFKPLIWPSSFSIEELRELKAGSTEISLTVFEEYKRY